MNEVRGNSTIQELGNHKVRICRSIQRVGAVRGYLKVLGLYPEVDAVESESALKNSFGRRFEQVKRIIDKKYRVTDSTDRLTGLSIFERINSRVDRSDQRLQRLQEQEGLVDSKIKELNDQSNVLPDESFQKYRETLALEASDQDVLKYPLYLNYLSLEGILQSVPIFSKKQALLLSLVSLGDQIRRPDAYKLVFPELNPSQAQTEMKRMMGIFNYKLEAFGLHFSTVDVDADPALRLDYIQPNIPEKSTDESGMDFEEEEQVRLRAILLDQFYKSPNLDMLEGGVRRHLTPDVNHRRTALNRELSGLLFEELASAYLHLLEPNKKLLTSRDIEELVFLQNPFKRRMEYTCFPISCALGISSPDVIVLNQTFLGWEMQGFGEYKLQKYGNNVDKQIPIYRVPSLMRKNFGIQDDQGSYSLGREISRIRPDIDCGVITIPRVPSVVYVTTPDNNSGAYANERRVVPFDRVLMGNFINNFMYRAYWRS